MAQQRSLIDDSILFCIDMVNDFLLPGEEFAIDEGRTLYPKMKRLLAHARASGIPIVHGASQHMNDQNLERFWKPIGDRVSCQAGTPGVEVVDELRPEAYGTHEVYLPKPKYSLFYGTRLDVILRNPPFRGRNTIIIVGMATNFCCMTTSIDAFNRDYDVLFINDMNCTFAGIDGTPAATMHSVTVETLKQGFVTEVIRSDELMARLGGGERASAGA